MRSLLSRKAFSIGGEGKLKKVTGSEANKEVTTGAVDMRAGPGSRIAFFLLDAAWVRSRAERPSVSYTKVTSKVAWTGHNLQVTNKFKQQIAAATNSERGDGKMERMREPSIKLIGEVHRMSGVRHCARVHLHGRRGARDR